MSLEQKNFGIDYIRKDIGDVFSLPSKYDDYRQVFDHDFNMSRNYNESLAVKQFRAAEDEWDMGLEILRSLHRFTFATPDQLCRLLRLKGLDDENMFAKILNNYTERKIINKFCLAAASIPEIPEDAMTVYCMDHGTKFILGHFGYEPSIMNTWKSSRNMFSGNIIFKHLTTNEFYISMCGVSSFDPNSFDSAPDFMIRGRAVRLSGWFQMKSEGKTEDVLVETIRKNDLPLGWKHKVDQHLTPFIKEDFANRYFDNEPLWIFATDSEDSALEAAEIFEKMTGCKRYRLVTSEELRKGLDKAQFYKYENRAVKPVRLKLFASV